jgi:hypothetical protein
MAFHMQNESAGEDKEPDWLPAAKGPFAAAMRVLYWRILGGGYSTRNG